MMNQTEDTHYTAVAQKRRQIELQLLERLNAATCDSATGAPVELAVAAEHWAGAYATFHRTVYPQTPSTVYDPQWFESLGERKSLTAKELALRHTEQGERGVPRSACDGPINQVNSAKTVNQE